MRKTLLLICTALSIMAFAQKPPSLTKEERKFAMNELKETRKGVLQAVRGLSDAQLQFKTAPDRWSVEDCIKHIAISEESLWRNVQGLLDATANPEKRSEIKLADSTVIAMITNRGFKAQAPEPFKPQNSPYTSAADALGSFEQSRAAIIEFIKKTEADMRNHVTQTPIGWVDAFQMVLFISAHSNRHTQQIREIMASPDFPKN